MGIVNYEEFKKLFIREDGKRKNKVILDMWKNREFMRYILTHPVYNALARVRTMAELFTLCDYFISESRKGAYVHNVLDSSYGSDKYREDSGGICFDGDYRGYRYYNVERESIFKMKIGKMYKHFCEMSEFGRHLPESVILYLCEEMTQRWMAEAQSRCEDYELYVDDDFARIYDSSYCDGDFGSCMVDDDNYHFYENAVDAKAAYITNKKGCIIARCVIFLKATDRNGKVWRLAERQYSSDGDEVYKRLLVHALIKGGHIDGYKKVGAGCHDPKLWMDVNDNPIADPRFSIPCSLSSGDYISYQDSFKWYDYDAQTAYNYETAGCTRNLDTTDVYFEGGNYDEWHEEYTDDELVIVYSGGSSYTCSEDSLASFRWVDRRQEYHHEDDVTYCEWCNEFCLNHEAVYSEVTGEYYCCDNCRDEAEEDANPSSEE